MKIAFLDAYTLNPGDNPLNRIAELGELTCYDRTPGDKVVERAKAADIIITNKTEIDAAHLSQLPRCRLIAVVATGYNIVDVKAARAKNIPVCNVPTYGTDSVAQFVFALLLELCHHVGLHAETVKQGEWTRSPDFCYAKTPLMELAGKTMTIIGYGRIGRRTGEIAKAFGMNVRGVDIGDSILDAIDGADVVSLHCPLTQDNKGMVNKDFLSRMKKTAFLINTSRGPLVNEPDLADALNRGVIAGAGIDVISAEPMKSDNPLLVAKNLLITPHIAWYTLEARRRITDTTAENIQAFLAGKAINVVN